MLGNNSCGIHSVMTQHYGYGARTSDNTESLTILTYDGVKMEVGPTTEDELEQIIRAGGRKGDIYENSYWKKSIGHCRRFHSAPKQWTHTRNAKS